MTNVAIIPARGGSKRIPRKNIKLFHGQPMIHWAIKACMAADSIDRIIVSSDDLEIQRIAVDNGAEVPFTRPPELSDDYSDTMAPMCHGVQWIKEQQIPCDHVCCVYPTNPMLQSNYIDEGYALLKNNELDYVFSATTYSYPIQRSLRFNDVGLIEMNEPENYRTRSQDLPEAWHDAGQFYWGTVEAWLSKYPVFLSKSQIVHIDRSHVQDIDTEQDWTMAENLFAAHKLKNSSG